MSFDLERFKQSNVARIFWLTQSSFCFDANIRLPTADYRGATLGCSNINNNSLPWVSYKFVDWLGYPTI